MTDLYTHMACYTSGTVSAISQDYFELFCRYLVDPLLRGDVNMCIKRLDEYCLTRDDLVEGLNYAVLGGNNSAFDMVESKVKASFTRNYSKVNHKSTNMYAKEEDLFSMKKSKKREKSEKQEEGKKAKIEESEEMSSEDDERYFVYLCVCLKSNLWIFMKWIS